MKRLFGIAAALVFTFGMVDAALAEMGAIYGPVYIVKNNHNGHEHDTKLKFQAPVAGDGIIVVKNGGDSGRKYRVSSATVELNEHTVVRHRDLNHEVDVIRRNVTLKGENELEVRVESCKECELEITVMGEKPAPAPAPAPPPPVVPSQPIPLMPPPPPLP